MADKDTDNDLDAELPKDVSRTQDVLVTFIVALIGTAVALGLYLQAGFGVVPSLSVGCGLFIWLLSAHFLMTRMRLKRLIEGRLMQLSKDVKKLKNELQVTELLAEGHNELHSGQNAIEKAIRTIVDRMDQYDGRLKILQKISKLSVEKSKRVDLTEQNNRLDLLNKEFLKLSHELHSYDQRYDQASQQQFGLMKAQLDVLELVVRQVSQQGEPDKAQFAKNALEAIHGIRQASSSQMMLSNDGMPPALPGGALLASGAVGLSLPPVAATEGVAGDQPFKAPQLNGLAVGEAIGEAEASASDGGGAFGNQRHDVQSGGSQSNVSQSVSGQSGSSQVSNERAANPNEGKTLAELVAAKKQELQQINSLQSQAQQMESQQMLPNGGGLGNDLSASPQNKPASDHSLLAAINEAIEANRIELFLQPIVGLPERELQFYEAFSRIRNDLGQLILPRDFMAVAEAAELAPIIDNQIVLRSIQVIHRLVERGKGRIVFCNLSLNSLRDADFFAEFMDFMEANKWLSEYLVFEFTEEAFERASAYEFERMTAISKLGFRFSLDQITRLDIDFKALADRQFGFVKINSSLLLGNMEGSKAQIHSADLNHYLNRLNITMIVDMVEREAVVRQLRDYNVTYAQGNLFCEPKAVRPEVFGNAAEVAA